MTAPSRNPYSPEYQAGCRDGTEVERSRIVALLATREAADSAARAVRRDKFARTSAIRSFDETVAPTEQELDDARAACSALAELIANAKE